MNEILIPSERSSHSGFGLSFWSAMLQCPYRRWLEDQTQDSEEEVHFQIGSYLHKLLEIYYGHAQEDYVLRFDGAGEDPNWAYALKIFGVYREKYPPDELGKVLACELKLVSKTPRLLFGVPKLTGQLDMLVRIEPEHVDTLMMSRTDLGVLEPGIYIVDTKTAGQRKRTLKEEYASRPQFIAYEMLLQELQPELYEDFKGTIANVCFKHKTIDPEKSFSSYWIPPASTEKREMLLGYLKQCNDLHELYGTKRKNPEMCFMYGGCKQYKGFGGTCDRTWVHDAE